jgi:hypothetical protein
VNNQLKASVATKSASDRPESLQAIDFIDNIDAIFNVATSSVTIERVDPSGPAQ